MSATADVEGQVRCESHHWVSTNVPGLLARWVIQCSLCGAYNVEEMNAALSAAGFGLVADAKGEAWDEAAAWVALGRTMAPGVIQAANPYRAAVRGEG